MDRPNNLVIAEIKKAYLEKLPDVTIRGFGWIHSHYAFPTDYYDQSEYEWSTTDPRLWRLVSLRNIDTNNGWETIQPDLEKVLDESKQWRFMTAMFKRDEEGNVSFKVVNYSCYKAQVLFDYMAGSISHYMELKEPDQPFF